MIFCFLINFGLVPYSFVSGQILAPSLWFKLMA